MKLQLIPAQNNRFFCENIENKTIKKTVYKYGFSN